MARHQSEPVRGVPRGLPVRLAPWWLNLDSMRPGSDERERLTAGGLSENLVPLVPAEVFARLPEEVKPLFRHWWTAPAPLVGRP